MTLSKTFYKYYYNFLHLTVNPPSKEDIQVFYFLDSKTVATMVAFLYILANRFFILFCTEDVCDYID